MIAKKILCDWLIQTKNEKLKPKKINWIENLFNRRKIFDKMESFADDCKISLKISL